MLRRSRNGIPAWSRVQQGKLAKAEVLCKRALEIRERTIGLDHPDMVTSLTTLGLLLEKRVRATETCKFGLYLYTTMLCL